MVFLLCSRIVGLRRGGEFSKLSFLQYVERVQWTATAQSYMTDITYKFVYVDKVK